jgi:hypothetical protein
MNNYSINLSSNTTNYSQLLPLLEFDDHTTLVINAAGISNEIMPIYIKIDWGDGRSETFDNSIASNGSTATLYTTSELFDKSYRHEYYPSENTLYKGLSAQVLVMYTNGNFSFFVIPIQIRTYDYFESIYDMHLKHSNILPLEHNPKEHYFSTEKDGYLIELRSN